MLLQGSRRPCCGGVEAGADLVDESAVGPSGELSVHGVESDVTEVDRDVAGSPKTGGIFLQQDQNPMPATLCRGDIAVVPGSGGQRGLCIRRFQDVDVEGGDGAASVGSAVVAAFAVAGDRGSDLAGAHPWASGRKERGQDPT